MLWIHDHGTRQSEGTDVYFELRFSFVICYYFVRVVL